MSNLWILLITFLLTICYTLCKRTFSYWTNLGIQQFPVTIPGGNLKGVGETRHLCDFFDEYYKKTKKMGLTFSGLYMSVRPVLLLTDLDLIKTILVKDFNVFPNRGLYYNEKDDPLGAHLLNIENDEWRNLRHKLTPTFTSGKLKMMFGTVCDIADKLISVVDKQMESTGQLNVKDTLARFSTDVIGTTAFGLDCNSLENKNSKFFEMGTSVFTTNRAFGEKILIDAFQDAARFFHVRLFPKFIADFYMSITRETVEYREKNPSVNRHDFINSLVEMKKQGTLTLDQIAAQSVIFYLAGFETSSSTMTYCMYELSLNEEIQEKAREDVRKALKKHNGELTYDAIGDMDYLEQCINESMRKNSAVAVVRRVALQDYKLPGTDIILPKGRTVFIPVQSIQWDEEIYPDPQKFDPDRFTPEEIAKRHPFAHMPFGEGPRICIGLRFAMVEMKIALAKILMKYKFTLDRSKTSVPLKMSAKGMLRMASEEIVVNISSL